MKKTRLLLLALYLLLIPVLLVGCQVADSNSISDIEVKTSSIPTTVYVDEFDIEDVILKLVYADGGKEDIYASIDMVDEADVTKLTTVGNHEIHCTYKGVAFVIEVNIKAVPTGKATAVTDLVVTDDILHWTLVDGASQYVVYYGATQLTTVSVNQYNIANVLDETGDYVFKVITKKFGDFAEDSDPASYTYAYVKPVVDTAAPNVTNLTVSNDSLVWNGVSGASSYKIYYNSNLLTTVSTTSYDISSLLSESGAYIFGVVTVAFGSYNLDSTTKTYTYQYTKPIVQTTAPSVTNLTVTNSELTWTGVSGATSYQVYLGTTLLGQVNNGTSYNVSSVLTSTGTYLFGVVTVAFGTHTNNSARVTYSYGYTKPGEDNNYPYTGAYYSSISAATIASGGTTLKSALRTLITTTHKKILSYNDLRTLYVGSDADPDVSGNIILFYSGISVSGEWDGGTTYNREHVWPQSLGWFSTSGAGSDLHHIRPTDPSLNTSRNNRLYAELPSGSFVKTSTTNGSIVTECKQSGNYFEPADAVKGDCARIIAYLLTRYSESDSYSVTTIFQSLDIFLKWNEEDPVDEWEMSRNDYVETKQGNRNPFIDHPEWLDLIW